MQKSGSPESILGSQPSPLPRRHDVDWLRTIAIGFLIVFHILLTFQSWVDPTTYPQNGELLSGLAPFVYWLAVWRIPLLFLISGMGVRFAMERRDWKALLKDRGIRILVPFLVGTLVFGPLLALGLPRLGWAAEYMPNFGHLWFLLNIFLYVLWLIGIFIYFKDRPGNPLLRFFSGLIRRPFGLFLFALPLMLEAWLARPEYFSIYIDNVHGWLLGVLCFFYGFVFISARDVFWPSIARMRWIALVVASVLFYVRLQVLDLVNELPWLTALESWNWMLTIVGFASVTLNLPSKGLGYLSKATYPVYIAHLPVQFILCSFLLPSEMSAYGKLGLLLLGTFGISFILYEVALRRLKWVRPLFGIKLALALFMGLTLGSCTSGQDGRSETETGFLDRSIVVEGEEHAYQVFIPRDYDPSVGWPAILFLHGAGERGNDGLRQTQIGIAKAIRANPERWPAIAVFPQVPEEMSWQGFPGEVAMAAMDVSVEEFNVDPSRVYLSGLSMGGNGTWYLAYHHTDRFAALVAVCSFLEGFGPFPSFIPDSISDGFAEVATRIARIPTWIVHGDADPVVPVEQSRLMAAALEDAGGEVHYVELPGVGHNAWDAGYGAEELAVWLFQQGR